MSFETFKFSVNIVNIGFCNVLQYDTGVTPGIFLEPKMSGELNLEAKINGRIPPPYIP